MNGYAWTMLTLLVALLVVQSWYYVEKVWDLNRQHQRHLEEIRLEHLAQDMMLERLTLPQVMVKEGQA
jgi:hypothetical protein